MKKKILIALILSLTTLAFTACGKDDENNTNNGNANETTTSETDNNSEASDDLNSADASEENTDKESTNSESTDNGNSTTSNTNTKGLVSFTLDPTFYDGWTDDQIAAAAADQQYSNYKINEDRSVYVEVTKERQQEMLNETRAEAERYFGARVGSEMNPKLTGVEINGDMTQFDLYFDGTELSAIDSYLALDCYLLGETFQTVNGVESEDYNVVVNYIDVNTNQVIESVQE